jgi:hypothetical protein
MTALQEIFVDFQNSAMPMELTALVASVALAWMCAWALGRGAPLLVFTLACKTILVKFQGFVGGGGSPRA